MSHVMRITLCLFGVVSLCALACAELPGLEAHLVLRDGALQRAEERRLQRRHGESGCHVGEVACVRSAMRSRVQVWAARLGGQDSATI